MGSRCRTGTAMPDRRADLRGWGQNMFGTNFCHVGLRGVGGKRLRAALLASTALVAAGSPAVAQDATWLPPRLGRFQHRRQLDPGHGADRHRLLRRVRTPPPCRSRPIPPLGGWTFNAGASAYTFTIGSSSPFNGAGIVINGGSATITNNDIRGILRNGSRPAAPPSPTTASCTSSTPAPPATPRSPTTTAAILRRQHGRQRHHYQ